MRAQRTGEGDHVDIAMTDGAFALQALVLGEVFAGQQPSGLLTGRFPCYALYACADGRHITVGALEPPFWRELCEGVGRPDLVPTQFDPEARATWREFFLTKSRDEWLALLDGRDACVGPVNSVSRSHRRPADRPPRDGGRPERHAAARHADQAAQPPRRRANARAAPG